MSITATTPTEQHINLTVPADPYSFARSIERSQPRRSTMEGYQKILFNKGRYFETTIYTSERMEALCALTGFKPQHTNMIVQGWKDLEDFVIAMNILGVYVEIDIDWI